MIRELCSFTIENLCNALDPVAMGALTGGSDALHPAESQH